MIEEVDACWQDNKGENRAKNAKKADHSKVLKEVWFAQVVARCKDNRWQHERKEQLVAELDWLVEDLS